jgi:hypothetical protein
MALGWDIHNISDIPSPSILTRFIGGGKKSEGCLKFP